MEQSSCPTVIVSHPRPHWSDYVAFFLLRWYGREKYPGIQDARIAFVADGRADIHDEWGEPTEILEALRAGNRVIPVGVGRTGYDEHGMEGRGECEATLVAADLNLRGRCGRGLDDLLDYTLGVDRLGKGKRLLDIGRAVELLHDVYPRNEARVSGWAFAAIRVLVSAGQLRKPWSLQKTDELLDRALIEVGKEFRPEVSVQILYWSRREREREPGRRFSAVDVAALMIERKDDPLEWLEDAVRAEMRAQEIFLSARPDFNRAAKHEVAVGGEKRLVILSCSGKRRFHQFAFHTEPRAIVVIVRRPSGHVQIFRNPKLKVAMENVAANIWRAEMRENGVPGELRWEELTAQNGPRGTECWFFQRDTGCIFNGSLATRDVPITKLTDREILQLVIAGLTQ